MPAGSVIVGKKHRTEHLNIIQRGKVALAGPDGPIILEGPVTFTSHAGVQKTLYIMEETVWSTIHVTELRDLESLERELIEPGDYPVFDRSAERAAITNAAAQTNVLSLTSENTQ